MVKAHQVADFLLFLKENDYRSLDLSNLKLQKLLYYCQGYYLAMYNEPMFEDPIEAWKYGPVVRDVYKKYYYFGDLDIKQEIKNPWVLGLNERQMSIVAYVWKTLGEMRPGKLVDKTHSETPWINTWFFDQNKTISNSEIKDFFQKNISEIFLVSK